MEISVKVEIQNLPDYAKNFKYIVARYSISKGTLCFYGAWNDYDDAKDVANRLSNGIVFERIET